MPSGLKTTNTMSINDKSTTLSSWARVVCNAIDAKGVDSTHLLTLAEISPDVLNDPEGRIRVSKMSQLWELAVEATGDEAFGLSVPPFVQPTTFHALGFSLMVSATLRDAWQRTQRYYKVVSDVLDIQIQEYGTESALCYVTIPGKAYAKEAIDAFIATMINLSTGVTGGSAKPTKVEFERAEPTNRKRFETAFPCDIYFGTGRNQIYFTNADLDRPLATANRDIALKNDEVVQSYLSRLLKQSMAKQVTEKIIISLSMGEPNQEIIANSLHMSSRNLQRKLKEETTSFRQLLDDVRKDLAKNYLASSQQSMIEIAYQLGFQDPSNFTRAFKRWFGLSPSVFRQQSPR
jgi:AraC-like DNA-binding protein